MGQIFPKSKYRYFHCDKFWLYGNIIDSTVRNSFIHNTFEDDALFKQISFFLNNKSTYVDVGANYGLHAMGVISLNQKKEIKTHLIEPNSDCISCLKKTVKRNSLDNVYLHEIALKSLPKNNLGDVSLRNELVRNSVVACSTLGLRSGNRDCALPL